MFLRYKSDQRGVTLLEVLVALSLFSLIMSLSLAGLSTVQSSITKSQNKSFATQQEKEAFMLLTKDVGKATRVELHTTPMTETMTLTYPNGSKMVYKYEDEELFANGEKWMDVKPFHVNDRMFKWEKASQTVLLEWVLLPHETDFRFEKAVNSSS